jgi:hypothetical protein
VGGSEKGCRSDHAAENSIASSVMFTSPKLSSFFGVIRARRMLSTPPHPKKKKAKNGKS